MTTQAPTNTSDMLLLHRMFRREFAQLPNLVAAASGSPERARVVGAYATELVRILHIHHHGEDELLYPLLHQRVSFEAELLDRMDAQHKEVSDALDAIETDLTSWTVTADSTVGARIGQNIERMLPTLVEHLAEEERSVLPIAATTVSQAEWDKLAEHGLGAIAPKRRLVVLGRIVADTSPEEYDEFFSAIPAPVRLLYKLVGRRQYRKEMAAVLG